MKTCKVLAVSIKQFSCASRGIFVSFPQVDAPLVIQRPVSSTMKYTQVKSRYGSLRLFAVLMMCCATVVHVSAMNDQRLKNDDARETGQFKPESMVFRERRSIKKNTTHNPRDFEKRLKILEER